MPAIVVPALIAAGGAVGQAAISAHAAGSAASQQQDAAQKALALQQQQAAQARTDYEPYRNVGAAALPQLAAFAGAPVVRRAAGPVGYQPGYQPGMTLGGLVQSNGQPPAAAAAGALNPLLAKLAGNPAARAAGMSPDAGQTVTLRAPTGQMKQFRADDPALPHFLQMPGVTRVG